MYPRKYRKNIYKESERKKMREQRIMWSSWESHHLANGGSEEKGHETDRTQGHTRDKSHISE